MKGVVTRTTKQDDFFTREKIELIKKSYCDGASEVELELFLDVCRTRQLDPVLKQIHAVFRDVKVRGSDKKERRMVIQVGIDGFRSIGERTGKYAGSDEPAFVKGPNRGIPLSAKVTVWKIVDGQRCPFTAIAYWDEFAPFDLNADYAWAWKKMPCVMLSKCAEAAALRKGFPSVLGGIYEPAELEGERSAQKISASQKKANKVTRTAKKLPPDTTKEDAEFVITWGRLAGTKIGAIEKDELAGMVNMLVDTATAEKRKIGGVIGEFIERAIRHLERLERGELLDEMEGEDSDGE